MNASVLWDIQSVPKKSKPFEIKPLLEFECIITMLNPRERKKSIPFEIKSLFEFECLITMLN